MNWKTLLILLLTNFLLVSCSNSENSISENKNQTKENKITTSSSGNNSSIYSSSNWLNVKIIKVDEKCIGCGKCVRIDPTHFKMNYVTHKAEPMQVNWHNWPLSQAIKHCPVDAITIW